MKFKRSAAFVTHAPGTYPATLTGLEPKEIVTADGPMTICEWSFRLEEGETEGEVATGTTSLAWSPKSKAYGWAKAVNANQEWTQVDADGDVNLEALVGRSCFVEVAEKVSPTGTVRTPVVNVMPDMAKAKPAAKRLIV
jgi:hypothetical protein